MGHPGGSTFLNAKMAMYQADTRAFNESVCLTENNTSLNVHVQTHFFFQLTVWQQIFIFKLGLQCRSKQQEY